MKYNPLGRTGFSVSEVSFGAWAIGGGWGSTKDEDSLAALHTAAEAGVNFFDTADAYGMGRSEKLLSRLKREINSDIYIATKVGRRLKPHTAEKYTPEAIRLFIEESLNNMKLEELDLLQLHCPPADVYYRPEIYEALDKIQKEGLIRNYGVSVERVEEALKVIEYPGVKTVQIVFNMFRQRPAELFFKEAKKKNIGIIVRVPLASGLLTGKMDRNTRFSKDDHRNFNLHGEAFDVGETFAGVPFEAGIDAVEELKKIKPEGLTMAQFALKWILMNDAVSCVIPGSKKPYQVKDNTAASDAPPLGSETMQQAALIYEKYIKKHVHYRW